MRRLASSRDKHKGNGKGKPEGILTRRFLRNLLQDALYLVQFTLSFFKRRGQGGF